MRIQIGKPILLIVVFAIIGTAGFYFLRHSKTEFLAVEWVMIEAPWPLEEAPLWGEFEKLKGKNILSVDTAKLGKKVAALPWVKQVRVTRSFPRTLKIGVQTKDAVAIAYQRNGAVYVARDGESIAPLNSVKTGVPDLPIIRMSALSRGATVSWSLADAVDLTLGVAGQLTPTFKLSELILEDYPYFKFYLVSPRVEVTADYNNWKSQLPSLTSLLQKFPLDEAQTRRINLVFAKKAIVSPPLSN